MLVSAVKAAAHFIDLLPREEWSPETTADKQGFVHPISIEGGTETTTVTFIIRDFDTAVLAKHEQRLKQLAEQAKAAFLAFKWNSSLRSNTVICVKSWINFPTSYNMPEPPAAAPD